MSHLISVIMPLYNAEKYVEEAIQSVLKQTYQNWELLIINDGSTDGSENVVLKFTDMRIKYFVKENGGVSSARNKGLKEMLGAYFCFLDADDVLPKNSLLSRMDIFESDKNINYVDGRVLFKDAYMKESLSERIAHFKGNPAQGLTHLESGCFFGNTWMIKREGGKIYSFDQDLTHGEDLFFYLQHAESNGYTFTDEVILHYRVHTQSAMSDLKGIEEGYRIINQKLPTVSHIETKDRLVFKNKTRLIMFKSYLGNFRLLDAFRVLLTW